MDGRIQMIEQQLAVSPAKTFENLYIPPSFKCNKVKIDKTIYFKSESYQIDWKTAVKQTKKLNLGQLFNFCVYQVFEESELASYHGKANLISDAKVNELIDFVINLHNSYIYNLKDPANLDSGVFKFNLKPTCEKLKKALGSIRSRTRAKMQNNSKKRKANDSDDFELRMANNNEESEMDD